MLEIDKKLAIHKNEHGFHIDINSEVKFGDCIGDVISIDSELNALWFDSRISYVLENGWRDEEYQEIEEWLDSSFKGSQIGSSIFGAIRKYFMSNGFM